MRACEPYLSNEPNLDEVLAAMLLRSGTPSPSPRRKVLSEVCWLFGNWVREQALTEGLQVVEASPRATLVERLLAPIMSSSRAAGGQ